MRYALLASVTMAAFSNGTVPTVIISTENGPVRINESDYDPEKHSLDQSATDAQEEVSNTLSYAEGVTPPPAPSSGVPNGQPPAVPSAGQMAIKAKGKKWIAVFVTSGEPVKDSRIDPKGYDSEQLAWEALMPVIHNPTPLGSPAPGSDNVEPGTPLAEASETV